MLYKNVIPYLYFVFSLSGYNSFNIYNTIGTQFSLQLVSQVGCTKMVYYNFIRLVKILNSFNILL